MFFRLTHPFAVQISKAVGIKWELRGKEILAEDRVAVVAMNHQSMFDILGNNYFTETLIHAGISFAQIQI